MPFSIPMSPGTKENASGWALPTRSFSCAKAPAPHVIEKSAAINTTALRFRRGNRIMAAISPSLRRQELLGIERRHVGRGWKHAHLDEGSTQHRQALGVEPA